ncbi:uncharacterized protein LOC112459580 [Temnothorax curvispinosus]|uniref:Uncharacterized protein LOC112459580 n=1 Tax=Temnothorax curvispinosus TaxID=300111 RepID=A0A6J1QB83_9HYME|nr:uncharacterized protein LOC112459580 [Temnothorax curvispinosus]
MSERNHIISNLCLTLCRQWSYPGLTRKDNLRRGRAESAEEGTVRDGDPSAVPETKNEGAESLRSGAPCQRSINRRSQKQRGGDGLSAMNSENIYGAVNRQSSME